MGLDSRREMNIDFSELTPVDQLRGETAEETAVLRSAAAAAQTYLRDFRWCGGIVASYAGIAVPGIVMVVLHKIVPLEGGVDEWLWTVTGDLPPAYIVTDDAENPEQALEGYVGEMRAWIEAVRFRQSIDDLIPVNAPATPEFASMLEARLDILERNLLGEREDE